MYFFEHVLFIVYQMKNNQTNHLCSYYLSWQDHVHKRMREKNGKNENKKNGKENWNNENKNKITKMYNNVQVCK